MNSKFAAAIVMTLWIMMIFLVVIAVGIYHKPVQPVQGSPKAQISVSLPE